MSKIGLFADVHVHPYARFSSVSAETGLNSWVEQALTVLNQIYAECEKRGITDVYCLGDLFHTGPRLDTRTFNAVYRFFQRTRSGWTTLIAGNHDQLTRYGSESALYSLENAHDRVHVVEDSCLNGNSILLLPYTENYRDVQHQLTGWNSDRKIVLGHLAVQGAVVGRHEYQPEEGCHPSWLDQADLVLLGHYHKRQSVTDKVQYIGSTMSIDFNDADEQKGFTILDTETLETEFVPIGSKKFLVFDDGPLQGSQIARGGYDGSIVRVDYSGELDEEKTRALMLERGAVAVTFKCTAPRQSALRVAEDDPRDAVQVYVDEAHDGTDGDTLVSLGRDIIRSVELAR